MGRSTPEIKTDAKGHYHWATTSLSLRAASVAKAILLERPENRNQEEGCGNWFPSSAPTPANQLGGAAADIISVISGSVTSTQRIHEMNQYESVRFGHYR